MTIRPTCAENDSLQHRKTRFLFAALPVPVYALSSARRAGGSASPSRHLFAFTGMGCGNKRPCTTVD